MGSSIRLAHFCCTTLISPCAASTAAGSFGHVREDEPLPNLSTASGSFTTYCAFFAIVALYHSTAGGRTRVFATSSAFVAMPVARATYCDISNTSTWSGPRAFRVIGRGGFARTARWCDSGAEDSADFARVVTRKDAASRTVAVECDSPRGNKKSVSRAPAQSNPACHAHTHTLTFKMVKMVESAEEFKALKMGDPVRALPGSAPRFEDADGRGTKNVAHVLFSTRARVFPSRASRSGAQSCRHGDRALGEPPRARISRPTSHARARVHDRPDPVDAARSRIESRFERTPAVALLARKSFFSLRLRFLFVAPTADAPFSSRLLSPPEPTTASGGLHRVLVRPVQDDRPVLRGARRQVPRRGVCQG